MQALRQRTKAVQTKIQLRNKAESKNQNVDQLQLVIVLAQVLHVIQPYADKLASLIAQAADFLTKHHAQDLLQAVYGLALCFFGGVFVTTIAAIEAANLFGADKIQTAFRQLHREWSAARLAFELDNKIDADGDGIRDVDELDKHELATRRLIVLSGSVDPEAFSLALEGLSCASVAILATLRVKFAAAITLGSGIGDVVLSVAGPPAEAAMTAALPDELDRWVPILTRYTARYIGVSLSWMLMRVTSSVFSSMRGSSLLVTGLAAYGVRHNYVNKNVVEAGKPTMALAWGVLAVLGFYCQASAGFRLSFPFNIILFPVTCFENFLILAVGSKTV